MAGSILYTKTRAQPAGSFITDLISSAGKTWDADYWLARGIFSTGRPPIFLNFRGDIYIAGAFSRVLVRHKQDRRFLPAGIAAPNTKIGVAEAGGSGGSSGNCLAYVTLLHKQGDLILAESARSNVVDVGAVTGGGFNWTNLPTTADYRVTHIRGYRSMDGDDYRQAWEAPFGITSFSENVLTLNLTTVGPGYNANGIPPRGVHYAVEFAGRIWYARNAEHPYRLWRSAPGQPQYVGAVDYLDTWDRSAITGVAKSREGLIVFTLRDAYIVRQFGDEAVNTFTLNRIDGSVGCVAHRGIAEIHNKLWFPSEDGVWIYDGGFFYAMRDDRPLWEADYRANKLAFQAGFAVNDRKNKTYIFVTQRNPAQVQAELNNIVVGTLAYVGGYEQFEQSLAGTNDQPDWSFDALRRRLSAGFYDSDGDVLWGSCDGQIRQYDDDDPDDDEDLLEKYLLIRHGLMLFLEPGGEREQAKLFNLLWVYMEAEFNDWTQYVMGGDEQSWRQLRPDNLHFWWKKLVAAGLSQETKTFAEDGSTRLVQYVPKAVHPMRPERVVGRGLLSEIVATSHRRMSYRGLGGKYLPGPARREIEFWTNFGLGLEWRIQGDVAWNEFPMDTLVNTLASTVTVEIRTTATYPFGTAGTPIAIALDFEGTNMPADAADSLTVMPTETTAVVFSDMDTTEASGTVTPSAEDANGIASNAADAQSIDLGTWDFGLEYRIDGGAWTPYTTKIVTTTGNTLEFRVVAYGSHYPTAISHQFDILTALTEDPVSAAGAYLEHEEVYPARGFGTYAGVVRYYDGAISGGVQLGTTSFLVEWTS